METSKSVWRKVTNGIYTDQKGCMLVSMENGDWHLYINPRSVIMNKETLINNAFIANLEAEAKLAVADLRMKESK